MFNVQGLMQTAYEKPAQGKVGAWCSYSLGQYINDVIVKF
jgi:hypothetical protein